MRPGGIDFLPASFHIGPIDLPMPEKTHFGSSSNHRLEGMGMVGLGTLPVFGKPRAECSRWRL